MGIFADHAGNSVKFFIQKDLPEDLQNNLRDAIQAEDGVVDVKVPIKGFVLIHSGTSEGERLRKCWISVDRPDRFVVPYTWVDASREAGKMIPQIFKKNGEPIKMRVHNSILNLNSRASIESRIENAGGVPTATDEEASIILCDPSTEVYEDIVRRYHDDPNKTVESHFWVKKCIDRGLLFHTGIVYKNPGGRRPGDERTAFTEDDEANLCTWIAAVIPHKESGGRTGNKIYQELVTRVNDPGYEWVRRHTWQSWRERYKKNAGRLDQQVAAIVGLGQAGPIGKAQFGQFRLSEGKQKALRKRRRKAGDDPSGDDSGAADNSPGLSAGSAMGVSNSQNDPSVSEETEWAIKDGQGPAPDWARREAGPASQHKRLKTGDAFVPPFAPFAMGQPLHPIDQAILDIANEFQFLPHEVQSFYDKTGDMEGTRNRFAKMRLLINTVP